MKKVLFIIMLIIPLVLFAQNMGEKTVTTKLQLAGGYSPPNQEGWGVSNNGFAPIHFGARENDPLTYESSAVDPGQDLGSTFGSGKAEARLIHAVKYPFLTGDSSLFKDNNFTMTYIGRLSPVSLDVEVSGKLSPAAFFNIEAGSNIGTGWHLLGFNGMGKNLPGVDKKTPESESFQGAVYRLWSGATLQFDFAAVWPGDWHHIILLANAKIQYMAYTNADKDEAWQWKHDYGMNFNGFKHLGTYFVGFKPPDSKIDTLGVLVATEQYIDINKSRSKMADDGWGSDFVDIMISPLIKFKLKENSSLTVLFDFKRMPLYTETTIGYRYFEYREYNGNYISLYRIALAYDYMF